MPSSKNSLIWKEELLLPSTPPAAVRGSLPTLKVFRGPVGKEVERQVSRQPILHRCSVVDCVFPCKGMGLSRMGEEGRGDASHEKLDGHRKKHKPHDADGNRGAGFSQVSDNAS